MRLLTYLAPLYNVLLAVNPAAPKAAFVALVFAIVMAWRRWFPASWVAYSGMVARLLGVTDDDTSKFKELLMHALQGIPAAVIGGILAVIGTGGDIKASISLALVALFAPLGHFLMSRYQGKLGTVTGKLPPGDSKPTGPVATVGHIVFANPRDPDGTPPSAAIRGFRLVPLAFLLLACSGPLLTSKRCDFSNPTYSLEVAKCRRAIVESCELNSDGTPKADCPALLDCEAWRKKECDQ